MGCSAEKIQKLYAAWKKKGFEPEFYQSKINEMQGRSFGDECGESKAEFHKEEQEL